MPRSRQSAPTSATGCSVPTSLFAAISETSTVSGRSAAAMSPAVDQPVARPRTRVTSKPSRSRLRHGSSTAGCSIAVVTMWRPLAARARAAPRRARLSDSVAPEVNTISSGAAPTSAATARARASTAACGLLAEHVAAARGVAEALAEVGQHRRDHRGIDGRGGVVVEVDHRLGLRPSRPPILAVARADGPAELESADTWGFSCSRFLTSPPSGAPAPGVPDPGEALREAARAPATSRRRAPARRRGAGRRGGAAHGQTAALPRPSARAGSTSSGCWSSAAPTSTPRSASSARRRSAAPQDGHLEIARFLLEQGAPDAGGRPARRRRARRPGARPRRARHRRVEPLDLPRRAGQRTSEEAVRGAARAAGRRRPRSRSARPHAWRRRRAAALRRPLPRRRRDRGRRSRCAARASSSPRRAQPEMVVPPVAERPLRQRRRQRRGALRRPRRARRVGARQPRRRVSFLGAVTADPAPLRTAARRRSPRAAPRGSRAALAAVPRPGALGHRRRPGRAARLERREGRATCASRRRSRASACRSPIVWGDRIFVTTAVSGKGDADLPHRPLRRRQLGRRPLRALLPALRARRARPARWSGSARSTAARPGAAPPQVEPRQRHAGHRRRARRRAVRRHRQARRLRLRRQAALAARRRHPRLQRPAVRHRRVGPRQLARSSTATWCSCRATGARTPSSPPTGWRRARRSGGWRARSPRPGRRPTSCPPPAGDELITNGQTIRAYDPRDRQAAVDAWARAPRWSSPRRWWATAGLRHRRLSAGAAGLRRAAGPARRPHACPRASARARRSPGATPAAAPTSRRRSSTAAPLHLQQQRHPHRLPRGDRRAALPDAAERRRRLLLRLAGGRRRPALLRRARRARSTSCAPAPSPSCSPPTPWARW